MKKVIRYAITYHAPSDSGKIHLIFRDGTAADVEIDSPAEAGFMLDLLRNEEPIYFDAEHELVVSGLEEVGEGED